MTNIQRWAVIAALWLFVIVLWQAVIDLRFNQKGRYYLKQGYVFDSATGIMYKLAVGKNCTLRPFGMSKFMEKYGE